MTRDRQTTAIAVGPPACRFTRRACLLMLFLLCPVMARGAISRPSLTGTDSEIASDANQIGAVRALVETGCPCSNFDGSKGKRHRNYVACAAAIINDQVELGVLRKESKARVKKYFVRSTCGQNPNLHTVPCIQRNSRNGEITCKIAPTTKKDGVTPSTACASSLRATRVACPAYVSCIEAADTNGDLNISRQDSGSCVVPLSPPSCRNGVQDNDETDVDCGGSQCLGCADNKMCEIGTDCANGSCGSGPNPVCQEIITPDTPISRNKFPLVGWVNAQREYIVWDESASEWRVQTLGAQPMIPGPVPDPCPGVLNCCPSGSVLCYSKNGPSTVVAGVKPPAEASWIYRTGFHSTPAAIPPPGYSLGWCKNGYCYRWSGWDKWSVSSQSNDLPVAVSLPPKPQPPVGALDGPRTGFSAQSFCDPHYCYEYVNNKWGVVALVIPPDATIMIPAVGRPNGEPNGFCDSTYCYYFRPITSATLPGTWYITTFSGAAPLPTDPPPTVVTKLTLPTSPPTQDVTAGHWTYGPSSGSPPTWVAAYSNAPTTGALPLTHLVTPAFDLELPSGSGDGTPISSNTFPIVGWADSEGRYYLWDQRDDKWRYQGSKPRLQKRYVLFGQNPFGTARNECPPGDTFCYSVGPAGHVVVSAIKPPPGMALIYRTGFRLAGTESVSPSYALGFCKDGYCYRWNGSTWNTGPQVDRVQGVQLTLDGPILPPNTLSPGQGFTSNSVCAGLYCYERTDGNWRVVALVIPAGATVMVPVAKRPDGQPNGFCDSTYCYYYHANGQLTGTWSTETFSATAPALDSPAPAVLSNPTAPPIPGGGDITLGNFTYTYSGGAWRVAAYSHAPGIEALLPTSKMALHTYLLGRQPSGVTPNAINTFPIVGWKDSSGNFYVWDQEGLRWLLQGPSAIPPPYPPVLTSCPLIAGQAPRNCCIGHFCYSNVHELVLSGIMPPPGVGVIYRTGLSSSGSAAPAGYNVGWCKDGYCYRWNGSGGWVSSPQSDRMQIGLPNSPPAPLVLPNNTPAPHGSLTEKSYCQGFYCYEQVGGVWHVAAIVMPVGATAMFPVVDRSDDQPNGFCDTTYCYYYEASGDLTGTWRVKTFSGIAPASGADSPTTQPLPIFPMSPGPSDFTFGRFTYAFSGGIWRVAAYSDVPVVGVPPVTRTIASVQDFEVLDLSKNGTPIFDGTFPLAGWVDASGNAHVWDEATSEWRLQGPTAISPALPSVYPSNPCGPLAVNCCVSPFCYSSVPPVVTSGLRSPLGNSLIYRTGIHATETTTLPDRYGLGWCKNGWCYRWTGWGNWTVSAQFDLPQIGTPIAIYNPTLPASLATNERLTSNSFCDDFRCFEYVNGAWGITALVIPSDATLMLPVVARPDGQPNGFCDGVYCRYYTATSEFAGTWSVTTFSGGAAIGTPTVTNPGQLVRADGQEFTEDDAGDYTFGHWTYTVEPLGAGWGARVTGYNDAPDLPVSSTLLSLQADVSPGQIIVDPDVAPVIP